MKSQERDRVSRQSNIVEINLVPPERTLFKVARFGAAYGRPGTINIHTDYSPKEMMSRFKALLEKKED